METHAQLFLRIARAFVGVLDARVFVFHTRLAEVTPLLQRDSARVQEKINAVTAGFGGGTRIATSLADFHRVHAKGQLGRGVGGGHLLRLRELQKRTRGFTEFVPLPFVHMEAPLYLKGRARKGPTFREALLMHAVARLALFPHFRHVQASWVKLGPEGVRAALAAGASDLGGAERRIDRDTEGDRRRQRDEHRLAPLTGRVVARQRERHRHEQPITATPDQQGHMLGLAGQPTLDVVGSVDGSISCGTRSSTSAALTVTNPRAGVPAG